MSSAITARALALDLNELRFEEREALLAELPPERRQELNALLQEIRRLAHAPQESFSAHWERVDRADDDADNHVSVLAATAPDSKPGFETLRQLDAGQLSALLANEPTSVGLRIMALLRASELSELPVSLRKAVIDHLVRQWASSDLPAKSHTRRSRWWHGPWRRRP